MDKDKLIEAQKEYITLLEEGLAKYGGYMASRSYIKMHSDEDIDKGAELRDKIKEYSGE